MNKFQRWKGIMKAVPLEEKRLLKWQPPFIVQPKYNGVRCRAVPLEDGNYILLSSEENVIHSVPHINKVLDTLKLGHELDGELYRHTMPFEEIVSITSRTVNLHDYYGVMQFHVFDIVNEEPQSSRIVRLSSLKNSLRHIQKIQIAPFYLCDNLTEIMRIYDNILMAGYEGIIVRQCNAPYERKRSTWVMKFKPKREDEYVIRWFQEEISVGGIPKGCLGSLICESGDGETFSVGTGFSEDQRHELWKGRSSLPGKIVRVQYQHLTSRKKVPRFPVFVSITKDS